MANREHRWTHALEGSLVVLGLLWAGVLRLGYPGVVPFAFDEARLSLIALDVARHGHWWVPGMVSSVGIPNFPGAAWLFAFPYALSTDPLVASMFMAGVSVLTLVGLWALARSWWGPEGALVTLWLAAGAPYFVFYSRSIWAQNWLPVLGIGWAFTTWWADKRGWAAVLAGFLAGFAWQVHYAGITLALASTTFLLIQRSERIRAWGAGFVLALFPAWPLLPRIWPHVQANLTQVTQTGEDPVTVWRHLLMLVDGYNWDWLFIGPTFEVSTGRMAQLAALGVLLLLALGSAGVWTWSTARGRRLLLIWLLSAPVLWSLPWMPKRLHYVLASAPAAFLLAGASVRTVHSHRWRRAWVAIAIVIGLAHGHLFRQGVKIAGTRFTPGGISTPLSYQRAAVRQVQDGLPAVIMAVGDNPATDGDAAVAEALFWGYPHRIADGRHTLLLPRTRSWLFFVSLWLPARQVLEETLPPAAIDVHIVPKRQGEYPFLVARVDPRAPQGFHRERPVPLANGVVFEGWKVMPQKRGFRWVTLWRVENPHPVGEVHQFNHVYVPGRDTPVMVQDVPLPWRAWRAGDRLITWVDFEKEIPPGGWLGVGMYLYPSLKRVERTDGTPRTAPIRIDEVGR